ncbi:MAG: tetratricopeptide repeat protein [Pseudomonadota bacterium]
MAGRRPSPFAILLAALISAAFAFVTVNAAEAPDPGASVAPPTAVERCQDLSDPVAAGAACTDVLSDDPDAAWAWNNHGLTRAAVGDFLSAITSYSKALSVDPAYAPALSNRGNAHAVLGDMKAALADHDRAVELDPDYAAALHNRGVDHEEMGQYEKALADYRKVIALIPDHRGSHVGLATANCKLGRVTASAAARLNAIEKGLLDAEEMQVLLKGEGHYAGPIDGIFGKGSRAALRAWTRRGCLAPA